MHWALQSIKRGNRAGLQAGLVLTFALGLTFLLTQAREYSRIGFAPHDGAFGSIFYGLTGLHGAHVFVGLTILHVRDDQRLSRAFHARGAPRRRDRRDLLALRRRNVDRGLHDGVHPLGDDQSPSQRGRGVSLSAADGGVLRCDRDRGARDRHVGGGRSCSSCSRSAAVVYVGARAPHRAAAADGAVPAQRRERAPDPRDRERDGRRASPCATRSASAPRATTSRCCRRHAGAELAASALGLGRGRRARRTLRSG